MSHARRARRATVPDFRLRSGTPDSDRVVTLQTDDGEDDDSDDEEGEAGPARAGWSGVMAVEGEMTGDGRLIEPGALRWDDLPIPFRWDIEDDGAHLGAVVVGRILTLERSGSQILGTGDFDLGSREGREAARRVRDGYLAGVSIDPDDVDFEIRIAADVLAEFDEPMPEDGEQVEVEQDTDEDGRVVVAEVTSDSEVMALTDARIRAATLVDIPAFATAKITLDADAVIPDDDDEDSDDLVASSAPRPPAGWFADPELDGPTGVTVTDEGRIYGHLALWGTCHTGYSECVTPPSSPSGYALFRTGAVLTDDGSEVPTGRITMDTGHAGRRLTANETANHYDHSGYAVADVAAGEDAHGIWVAGAVRPGVTDDQVAILRGSPLSGDWRRSGNSLELVAALCVNSPGFPVPRGLVADGRVQTLVAAGGFDPTQPDVSRGAGSTVDVDALGNLVRREVRRELSSQRLRPRAEDSRRKVRAGLAAATVRRG